MALGIAKETRIRRVVDLPTTKALREHNSHFIRLFHTSSMQGNGFFFRSIQQHMPFRQPTVRLNQLQRATCVESFAPLNHTHEPIPNRLFTITTKLTSLGQLLQSSKEVPYQFQLLLLCLMELKALSYDYRLRIQMLGQIFHDFHKRQVPRLSKRN